MPRPLPLLIALLIPLLLIPAFRASAQDAPPVPTLISLSSTGEPGNGNSSSPSLSTDGRWIAFASDATNLVPNDTNGVTDIFVHDRQTGETTRVSVSTNGEQGNGRSTFPAISGNGRYVAFQSEAANLVPTDTNGLPDIFVHDRQTGETKRASVGLNGEQANGESSNVSLSHDGRYLAYQTMASNLVRGDDNGAWDVYVYDNGVTGNVVRASVSSEGVGGNKDATHPKISGDGRIIVFSSDSDNLVTNDKNTYTDIFMYNRVLATTERISISSNGVEANAASQGQSISYSGRYILFGTIATNLALVPDVYQRNNLMLRDTQENTTIFTSVSSGYGISDVSSLISPNGQMLIFVDIIANEAWLMTFNLKTKVLSQITKHPWIYPGVSFDGNVLTFESRLQVSGFEGDYYNIFVIDNNGSISANYLSGRVTDLLSHPLALVTVTDQHGNSTRTDLNGYFWLAGYAPGSITLTLEKEGYTLTPSPFTLQLSTDITELSFTATPTDPLEEARLDLGMPYQFDRGCPDPYIGCGGKYHGFHSGYCTDLILDAYTYGADFDIQFDLEQDTRAHPEHFYRWHDARDAHDMWRFFSYSGQMLPNTAPYAPGDIVFFDWTEDGEIDHVALVSEVDANHHPVKLLDATGKTDFNPSGLAAELPWQEFYDRTARGHARWSGAYQPVIPFPAQTQMLQIAASGANINLRLTDSTGGALSLTENSLPAGWYTNLIWEESASVEVPAGGAFTAEISNPTEEPAPFRLAIQLVVHGIVIGRVEASGNLPAGARRSIPIFVELDENGVYQLTAFPSRIPKIRGPLK